MIVPVNKLGHYQPKRRKYIKSISTNNNTKAKFFTIEIVTPLYLVQYMASLSVMQNSIFIRSSVLDLNLQNLK